MENTTDFLQTFSENITEGMYEKNLATGNVTNASFAFDWVNYTGIGFLVFLTLTGVPANCLMLFVKSKSLNWISTDFFVITLGAFDLFGLTYTNAMTALYRALRSYVISPNFCKFLSFGSYLLAFETTFLFGAIAVDRCILSFFPHNRLYTPKVGKCICIIISAVSVILTCPYFFLVSAEKNTYGCVFIEEAEELINWWNRILIALIFITCLIITVCYLAIVIMLRRRLSRHPRASRNKFITVQTNKPQWNTSNKGVETTTNDKVASISETTMNTRVLAIETTADQREDVEMLKRKSTNRTTMILFILSLIYIVSWCLSASVMVTNFKSSKPFSHLAPLFRKLTMVLNPVLYMGMSSKFRGDFKKVLCCRRKPQ